MKTPNPPNLVRQAAGGAAASVVASLLMDGVMVGARAAGLLGERPPRKLTRKFLGRFGFHPRGRRLTVTSTALHFGYGGGVGALVGPALRKLPTRRARMLGGAAVGAVVWATSYAGWIPAVGWMAKPSRDRPRTRPWVMLAAHLCFGGVLGAMLPSPR